MFRCRNLIHKNLRYFSSSTSYDVVFIGGGPGGYAGAIKAAQLGLKTACVEKRGTLGGTCLNVGCIPSKALLNASHMYHDAQHKFKDLGIDINGDLSVNLEQMMKTKEKSVNGLCNGIEGLFKKNKVDYYKGFGVLESANTIKVETLDDNIETLDAKNIVIATGSEAATLPNIDIDEKSIVTSTGALSLEKVPDHLVVIGAGVIGLELGSVWSRLGAKVTCVEYLDRITPGIDNEVAKNFQRILKKQGIDFKLKTAVQSAVKNDDGTVTLTVEPSNGGNSEEINADIVLVATGRRPYTEKLNLEAAGVEMDGLMVKTNEHLQTNVSNIYAIGDVVKGAMLAHKAEEEGIAVAETIAKGVGHVNYDAIPGVIYTHPEVATVGKSEEDLKAEGIKFKKGSFPMLANSRARANNDADGFIKVLADAESDRILGVHMIGANAGELIAEAVLGLEYGASSEDLARTCHAHPTLSEAVKEACMATYDKPIHM